MSHRPASSITALLFLGGVCLLLGSCDWDGDGTDASAGGSAAQSSDASMASGQPQSDASGVLDHHAVVGEQVQPISSTGGGYHVRHGFSPATPLPPAGVQ